MHRAVVNIDMVGLKLYLVLASFCLVHKAVCVSHALRAKPQYDELYADAMRAYNKKEWATAVTIYEAAIADWKEDRFVTLQCRTQCKNGYDDGSGATPRTSHVPIDYLIYLDYMKNCTQLCIQDRLGVRFPISKSIQKLFDEREPFTFLQFAYHKIGENKRAARAATTFLRFFPNDGIVSANIKLYQTMPELKDFDVDVSLEPIQHHELYEKGRVAYNAKDWTRTVKNFEEALNEYSRAYNECQIACDVEAEGRHQYLTGGVYAYHMKLLYCRLDCPRKLSMRFTYPQPAYLSKHYDFLQYSYGQVGQYTEAMRCAASFQLFDPISEHMHQNIEYYKSKGVPDSEIKPRKEAQYLHDNIWTQMRLLRSVKSYLLELDAEYKGTEDLQDTTYERFMAKGLYPDDSLDKTEEIVDTDDEDELLNVDEPYKNFPLPTREHIEEFIKSHKEFEGVTLTMSEEQINGSYRAVFDGVATKEECKKLTDVGLTFGRAGDGYNNNPSPHTAKELFLGLNINNATWAAAKGDVPLELPELYMSLSEKVRVLTEAYFRLATPLYFSYTHLVCRKALSGADTEGHRISHPLHSDNCILKQGKVLTCIKEYPAYTWRDYSGLLYINDNFTGGEFVFANSNKTIEAIVKPQCGRVVIFSAGFENLHGVLGVKEGIRCALPIWFTLDKQHVEHSRNNAAEVLKKMRKEANEKLQHKEL